jgi:hypothetical protein
MISIQNDLQHNDLQHNDFQHNITTKQLPKSTTTQSFQPTTPAMKNNRKIYKNKII